jgi:hypothetical protein
MTTLAQLVWDCTAIGGMDKLVLMGWVEQVPDGDDLAYASKETVAECVGVSGDTVFRHTKALVREGWLIATGGRKQWKNGWTAVYQVNLELLMAQYRNLLPVAECHPPQDAVQGYRFGSFSFFSSPTRTGTGTLSSFSHTGVPPVAEIGGSKDVEQTDNLEPKTVEPKPIPHTHGRKSCPDCGEPLQRDVNHLLVCKEALQSMDMEFEFDGYHAEALFPGPLGPQAEGARQRVEAERQKEIESILADGRARATTTAFAQPPVAPTSLCMVCAKAPVRSETSDYCLDCWDKRPIPSWMKSGPLRTNL